MEPELTQNSIVVLQRRYLIKDSNGNVVESPEQLFHRVANVIAAPDEKFGTEPDEVVRTAEQFYDMIAILKGSQGVV